MTAAAVSTAGYTVGYNGGDRPRTEAESDPVPGVDLPVPSEDIETRLGKDSIPAVVDPAFAADWSGLDTEGIDDPTLPDETAVIGLESDGAARAYPLRVLNWHEIVNGDFAGPIAVTYCVMRKQRRRQAPCRRRTDDFRRLRSTVA